MEEVRERLEGAPAGIAKAPTGIRGLDEITQGGLPRGRPTLIVGTAGCGKTMFGMQFLVHGITEYDEPGVFFSFEEGIDELAANFASLGYDLRDLEAKGKLSLDHIDVGREEFEETGEFDLEGLFIRLGLAIDSIGAKRVVLDTVETLFGGIPNAAILRAELHRLFSWLRDKGVTAVITGEAGVETITRQGLEEYVSDCVIVLSNVANAAISTRRLRVVKYRGSAHGSNEYPFLIDENGITVLPITSLTLEAASFVERVSTGIEALDAMLDGAGFFRGSSVLVSGMAGTGKSSIGASFVAAACQRGERCLYVSFEEGQGQLVRNMRSIGIDLGRWIDEGLLEYHATRATVSGLEMHLVSLYKRVERLDPSIVVIDPMTSFMSIGTANEVQSTLIRIVDYLKSRGITAVFTSLVSDSSNMERIEESVSSLMDTWILLRNIVINNERNRTMYVLKSRGMSHSNEVREFLLTDEGIKLEPVYVGPRGVLTGTARQVQASRDEAELQLHQREMDFRQREVERKRQVLEARIAELQAEFGAEEEEAHRFIEAQRAQDEALRMERSLRRTDEGRHDDGRKADS